jgi:hypothetical protein
MPLARVVFRIAAVWGVIVLAPLYFLFDTIGTMDPPPITHPGFYYGFVGVGLTWQIVFWIISRDPVRYRALMIPAILEKASWGIAVIVLVRESRMRRPDLLLAGVDLLLGVLFAVAFWKTPKSA